MGNLFQDVLFSLRALRKSPGFTVAAIATLALAIGANAAVFSVMNAFILRPLNVPNAESLYALFRPGGDAHQSYPDYIDLRQRNRSFDDLSTYNITVAALDTGGNPSPAWMYETSANYFEALGIQPYLGRVFHDADDRGPGSAPYIVLSYAFWHVHFHDDRSLIGQTVELDRHPFTIIGVAPPEFHGTLLFFNPQFYVPVVSRASTQDLNARGTRGLFMVMGHLKPGITPAQAVADLNLVGAYLEKNYPKDDGNMKFTLNRPSLYGDYLGRPVREFMTGLMLLSGLILLAACANLGSLFAARAADRSKEIAVRLALGSSHGLILRRLFTEAILVSVAGGVAGVWGSVVLLQTLSVWEPFPRYPLHLSVNPDAHVYAFALLLTLASGFLFGAVPVKQVLRTDPYQVIKSGTMGRAGRRLTLRDVLLVAQIAICAVLVTSSIVAIRGLARSLHAAFGFDVQNTLLADTDLGMAGYNGDRIPPMQKRMLETVQTIPGVEAAALANTVPMDVGTSNTLVFSDKTEDTRPARAAAEVDTYNVSPGYFRAAGTALLAGREFSWHDDKDAPPVAIVNHEFARKIFGSVNDAVGGYFKLVDGKRVQVVAVTEQGKYDGIAENPQPVLFLPILQWPTGQTTLVLRTKRDPRQVGAAVRARVKDLDATIPIDVQTRYQGLDFVLFGPRMATIALGVLGVMGAMLSITGIFGLAAYSVSKRLKDLGIRIAVGAQPREVLEAALARPLKLLAIGSAVGLILGVLASRVLALVVDQATPKDPVVLAGVVLAMAFLGLIATWIPARRALAVDPMVLLREE